MATYAALASLMNNIEQMKSHPHLYNSLNKKQIQALFENSGFLLDIINGNKNGAGSNEAEDLERHITSAAHAAEDIIESHIVDQIYAAPFDDEEASSSFLLNVGEKLTNVKYKVKEWVRRIASASPIVDLQRIIEEMEDLRGKAKEEMKIEREKQPPHSTLLMESGETAMVGLDDELTHLLGELTGHQSNRHTISIVGMGGMGKTTLARNIYANPMIIEHFDILAWATLSQQYDAQEVISQLLSTLGKVTSENVGQLGEQLYKALIGKRYLVILDDIWSVEAWDKVRHYFPDDGSSSRVLLTTRLSNVASVCGSSCLTMNLLDEGKSWKLFCQKALFPHKDDPIQLEDVGKEIVRSLKGLALSIVVIGGLLLKSPRTLGYWKHVAENLKSIPDSKEKQQSIDILSLSYSELPSHLKPCFLYMGAFDEDSEIRVSKLTRLWVAEGFIRPNGTRVLEDIAKGFLNDLVDRNLVLVSRRRYNREIGSLGIHDLVRDLCIKVAQQQEFFHVRAGGNIQSTDRRVVCNPYQRDMKSPLARSILTRNMYTESIRCKLLRVLADERNEVYNPNADVLYLYVNLRYLAYQKQYGKLPTSLSLMWNLQTLIISGSPYTNPSQLVVAPSIIWKMQQLRHIKCLEIYLPHPPPSHQGGKLSILGNFQTLGTAVNMRLSEEVCKIIPNIKKLGLRYYPYIQGYDDTLIECLCNLDLLLKLESLKMEMDLRFRPNELNTKLALPSSLRKLSLSGCGLHWNDLGMIGLLPRLQVLYLGSHSVTKGDRWRPGDGQFRRLKVLKIDGCELCCWDADNSHFPVLEKLVVVGLKELEEIPLDIGDIPTLELIGVLLCSESAAISAMRIKDNQQDLDNDALEVQINIRERDVESFMKMVEVEQLTLENIRFEINYY